MSETDLIVNDLTTELWREYEFAGRTYHINAPKTLYQRKGGSTHRVLDSEGVVHCVPGPSNPIGVVLRWKSRDPSKPVDF